MLGQVQLTERNALLTRHDTQADDSEEPLIKVAKKAKSHRCMIRMNNSNKTFWDIFILIAAIWNCVCIPQQIAFEPVFLDYAGIEALNSIIDVCFCLDVVACCRTTFYDTLSGDEVFDQKRCALKYIKSFQFFIDLISSIPLDTLSYIVTGTKNKGLQLFSLLKLVRISRIPKIIVKINVSEFTKNILKLCQLILMVFIYLHLMGCIWFYIADQDKLWGPDQVEVARFHYIYDDSPEDQYWQSFYSSVIMLVGKDISPINKGQVFFVVFSLMFGALLNANIFGNIALLASEIRKKQTALAEVIDTSNTAMKSIYLNQELTVKTVSYIQRNSEMIFLQQELQGFLDAVSVGLQTRVLRFMFHQALKENQLVSDDFGLLLIANVKLMLLGPEETIIRQNDEAGDIFVIYKGECVVYVNDSMYVKTLYPGMIFGECATLLGSTRTATVKTESFLILGRVDQGYFTELLNRDAAMHAKFVQNMENYQDFSKSQKKHFIKSIECLQSYSPQQIETIYQSSKTLTYQADETIWSFGDKLTYLFILLSGSVETYLRSPTDEILSLDLLSEPGSIFNQTFSNEGINYSLKCVRNCTFLVVSRSHLTQAPHDTLLDYQIKRPNLDDFGQPFLFDARKTLVKAISKVLKVIKSKQVSRLQALFNFFNRMHTEAADQNRELIKAKYFLGLVNSRLEKRVKFVSTVTRLQKAVQNCNHKLAQVMDLLQDCDDSSCVESRHRYDTPEIIGLDGSKLNLTYEMQQLMRLSVQQSMSELDYSYELDSLPSIIKEPNPARNNNHHSLYRISEVELQFESSSKQLVIKPR